MFISQRLIIRFDLMSTHSSSLCFQLCWNVINVYGYMVYDLTQTPKQHGITSFLLQGTERQQGTLTATVSSRVSRSPLMKPCAVVSTVTAYCLCLISLRLLIKAERQERSLKWRTCFYASLREPTYLGWGGGGGTEGKSIVSRSSLRVSSYKL